MDVNGGSNATQGPCDGVFKSTYIEGGLNATINARLDGVDGLVLSIRDCQCFKTFLSRFPPTTQNLNSLFLYHAYTTFHIMEGITYVTLVLSLP